MNPPTALGLEQILQLFLSGRNLNMFGNRKTVMAFQILAPALSKIANEYERGI